MHATARVRAVVDILQVSRALEVLIQAVMRAELFMAKIAFEAGAIPSIISIPDLFTPSEQLVGDDALSITALELLIDEFAVDTACFGA